MKRVLSIVCILALTLCCLFAFTSCAKKLSGSYQTEVSLFGQSYTMTYTFSGKNVTVESKTTILGNVNTNTYEGTYEIAETDDGKMEITLNFEGADDKVKSGTYTLEESDEYIKIAGVQYNKVEK